MSEEAVALIEAEVTWREGLRFDARAAHGALTLGGSTTAPDGDRFAPKELVALGLAGCTGMDVVSILEKMHATPERFSVAVRAETADTHPRYLRRIEIEYRIDAKATPEQARRAVTLSLERYCGVSATLEGKSELVPVLVLNGERIDGLGRYGATDSTRDNRLEEVR
jgi:putative redox protein